MVAMEYVKKNDDAKFQKKIQKLKFSLHVNSEFIKCGK
jgi:hypothetical protein